MKLFFLSVSLLMWLTYSSQTATNWTVTDCSGANHELFKDLDAGKVAVIIWVMPCANCINGALAAQTEVQNALVNFPGMVLYYLADDAANTNCTTLSSWATTNGINDAIIVTSKAVSMSPYGAAGMPKIVVVGGGSHKVYYNKNAPNIVAEDIKNAIATALADPTGVNESIKANFNIGVYPNPTTSDIKISLEMIKGSKVKIELFNMAGQKVSEIFSGEVVTGSSEFTIKTSNLSNGSYFINISDGNQSRKERLIINH